MKLVAEVDQGEVFSHWEKVEKITITQRIDIVFPLITYTSLKWYKATIDDEDISKIYIISSDDWRVDGLCQKDFKLTSAIAAYKQNTKSSGKYADIQKKQQIYESDINGLDTKLVIVSPNQIGPFTIIEGNKRSVALLSANKFIGLNIYLGLSPYIRNYVWARYSYQT